MKIDKTKLVLAILISIAIILLISFVESRNEEGQTLKFGEKLVKENKKAISLNIDNQEVKTPPSTTGTSATATNTQTPSKKLSNGCKPGLSGKSSSQYKAILLNWYPCPNEDFQFYKLVKSSLNSNPGFPNDDVILSTANKNTSNFIDKVVTRGVTYHYRVCVMQKLNNVTCGNRVSVKY